jgi:hypothetical protein
MARRSNKKYLTVRIEGFKNFASTPTTSVSHSSSVSLSPTEFLISHPMGSIYRKVRKFRWFLDEILAIHLKIPIENSALVKALINF